ncbi:FAD-binding oxidoreductase [Sciscionella marina]|uniref:FAD-binding oxidoreductase n=1 Tax=Sciscionella marina TaxID=508770 RepID=UPI000380B569|nr:FAD-linked oxidase C-terminal domain-containing protein [Sciscionella marina]
MRDDKATGRLEDLAARLTTSRLLTDHDVTDAYRRDHAHLVAPGRPCGVLLAERTEDVATALAWAGEHGVPVVPRGAGTGLAGGATATDGCLIVSTAQMTAIRELEPDDMYAVVEAGVINADLKRAAAAHGLMYSPDPSSFEISTIGGNLATNAGGLGCVKYGVTRDSVLGLEAVLADGRTIHTGRRTVKGVAGLDLTGLFVGSEGSLGIITSATVTLRPRPRADPVTIVGSFPSLRAAAEAVAAIVRQGIEPSLLELIDRNTLQAIDDWKHIGLEPQTEAMLIAQLDSPDAARVARDVESAYTAADADFAATSSDASEAAQLLEMRRLAYPAAERLGHCLVEDIGVPRSRLPEMIEAIERIGTEHSVTILTVAHAGDGNLHPTFVFEAEPDGNAPAAVWCAADETFQTALDFGGTLTGEHGVGALKRPWLEHELGCDILQLQQAIKTALDPRGIMNPGKAY